MSGDATMHETAAAQATGRDPRRTAPVAPGGPSQAFRGVVVFLVLGVFLTGFALGRMGTGVRSSAARASVERAEVEALKAAKDSLPDAIKYEVFLNSAAQELPMGFTAKGFDANGNLVLYATRVEAWARLEESQRRAIMGFLGAAYTSFRLQYGIPTDLSKGHPVLSIAGPDGTVLASRGPSGEVLLFERPTPQLGSAGTP